MSDIHVTDDDVLGALEALNTIVGGLQLARRAGIVVGVDELVALVLLDAGTQRDHAKCALLLALALQRLASL
jgi:hypothetical protein